MDMFVFFHSPVSHYPAISEIVGAEPESDEEFQTPNASVLMPITKLVGDSNNKSPETTDEVLVKENPFPLVVSCPISALCNVTCSCGV